MSLVLNLTLFREKMSLVWNKTALAFHVCLTSRLFFFSTLVFVLGKKQ